ncbi:MAG: HD domain-containing protein [Acidobacteria bacterium]|nr:HD domain-containing protein [Acidobacteriota bacterium]
MDTRAVPAGPDSPALHLARAVATRVHQAGGRALIVGGWTRDWLRRQPSKDIDIEVFGIPREALAALLEPVGHVLAVGQSFPVYKVVSASGADRVELDVALPRRESKQGRGHRGFAVEGDPSMTIAEAARRRDFTVNAVSWDPLTGEVLDPFDGRADLDAGRLRAVDPRTFADDSLRVLRAVQFAARFGFTLEPATAALCRRLPLDDLPAERVWGELEKLLGATRPSIGFALALELGVVDQLLPELRPLVGCEQEPEWHPEGDVWVHTLLVIDRARALVGSLSRPRRLAVLLGALCHDLGKPATTAVIDGRIRSLNHEEAGVAPTHALLDRLNVHTVEGYDLRGQVVGLVAQHLKPGMFHKAGSVGDGAFRRLARKVDMELLALVARADCEGRTGTFDCSAMDWFLERARALGVEHAAPPPLLLGRHVVALGVPPGPAVGRVLAAVYEQQLDGAVTSVEAAVAAARAFLESPGDATGDGA